MPTAVNQIRRRGNPYTALDAATSDNFGVSVALSGDGKKMVVGAFQWEGTGTNRGGVYTNFWDDYNESWYQEGSVLIAADGAASDNFGSGVALSADGLVMAVGAWQWEGSFTNQGAVYIYDWDEGTLTWTARGSPLTAADGIAADLFGISVALNGDGTILVVGATSKTVSVTDQGAAYVFDYTGGAWVQRGSVVVASDPGSSDDFGVGVSISGDGLVLAVGADSWEGAISNQGAVYVYDWNSGSSTWVQRGSGLQAPDAAVFDNFGVSVSLNTDGSMLAVGARFWEGTVDGQGGVYLFTWNGSAWTQIGSVISQIEASSSERFGDAVAINANATVLAVGVPYWDTTIVDQGAVYVYDIFSKELAGTVEDYGVAVSRTIRAYDRSNGLLVGDGVSDGSGVFSFGVKTHNPCFLVFLDDLVGDAKNALVYDKITPV